jgi:threonine/homoserine/homoserine lactone efflux protein
MSEQDALIYSIATFSLATSLTPGPNNLMLLASGVNFGFRRSMPHVMGVSLGFFVMLVAIGFGLNSLFQAVPSIYHVMKVLGFAYLVYLAWGVATRKPLPAPGQQSGHSSPLSFWGAVAFQWVNPKAWLIAVSFSSNYLPQQASPLFVFFCCLLVAVVNLPSICVWLWMGTRLELVLRDPVRRKIFNWGMALLLVASMLPVLWL